MATNEGAGRRADELRQLYGFHTQRARLQFLRGRGNEADELTRRRYSTAPRFPNPMNIQRASTAVFKWRYRRFDFHDR